MPSSQAVYSSQMYGSPGMVNSMYSPGMANSMPSPGMANSMPSPGMAQPMQYGQMSVASQVLSSQCYSAPQPADPVESIFQTSTSYTYGTLM